MLGIKKSEVPYFTATPHGRLSVGIAGCAVSAPVAGVIAYCETVLPPSKAEPKFVTNIQLSSPRIAIDIGP